MLHESRWLCVVQLFTDVSGRVILPDGRALTPELGHVLFPLVTPAPRSAVIAYVHRPIEAKAWESYFERAVADLREEPEPDQPFVIGPE